MAEWSKALDLSSSGRKSAWVRTPLQALFSTHQKMTPEGFEPPAFGFGIQRAAVAPWSQWLVRNSRFVWLVLRSQQLVHGWDHSVDRCKQSRPITQRTRVTYSRRSDVTKVTSLRTDTTLDLSQKAEKVCALHVRGGEGARKVTM